MSNSELLDHLPLTVIHIKTVNDTQSGSEVVAVSCVRIRNLQVSETRLWLLNPEILLPEEFTRSTGLYNAALLDKPALNAALPEIASFVGRDIIFWAHSPQKTNAMYRHFRLTQPRDRQFFVQTLAQKALPDQSSHTLPVLAKAFQLAESELLRPETSASTAGQILLCLLKTLQQVHGIHSLADLLTFCPAVKPVQRRTRRDLAFDRDRLQTYPVQPGVYFMKNRLGEILYIGKAKNLRNRLRSYFQKQSCLPAKIAAMMKQVCIIDTIVVGSELEALLLEAQLIKQHLPFFNQKVKNFQRMIFMQVSTQTTYPKLNVAHDIEDPSATYFGPFSGLAVLRYKMDILNRVFQLRDCSDKTFAEHRNHACMQYHLGLCSGPCAGLISPADYQESVRDFLRYLEQKPSNTIDRLLCKRDAYTDDLKFEKAAAIQEQFALLEHLQLQNYELIQAIDEHHCFIILPHIHPQQFRILTVLQGQPAHWLTFYANEPDESILMQLIQETFQQIEQFNQTTHRSNIAKSLFEEARLISSWLQKRTDDQGFVIYLKQKSEQQVLNELRLILLSSAIQIETKFDQSDQDDEAWEWEKSLEG